MLATANLKAEDIGWRPHPGSQRAFLECPYWSVLYHGTRGPGKTDGLLMDYAQHTGQGYGAHWRGILFRRTYKQLSDVVARTQQWFNIIFPGAKFNHSDMEWTFPDGEKLLLRYLRVAADYYNYHGHQYPWMGFEELTNWPNSEPFDMMMACSRSSHPNMPRKVRATANPYGVGHNWVKRKYGIGSYQSCQRQLTEEGLTQCHVFGDLLENEALMRADPEYLKRLDALAHRDEALYQAWRHGNWDIVAGGAFDDVWDRKIHYITPFRIPETWFIDRSFDWGSTSPASVLWWAESDGSRFDADTGGRVKKTTKRELEYPSGTLFAIAEWYVANENGEGLRKTNRQLADGVNEREAAMEDLVEPGPADTQIFDVVNDSSIATEMEDHGVYWTRADKSPGSRVNGLQIARSLLLNAKEQPMEYPGLFVWAPDPRFPGMGCPKLAEHLPVLARDEKNIEDVDTDQEDHDWDATRYRLLSERSAYDVREL